MGHFSTQTGLVPPNLRKPKLQCGPNYTATTNLELGMVVPLKLRFSILPCVSVTDL